MIKPLPDDLIQEGIRLLGINPTFFYRQGEKGRLAFRHPGQICQVCGLGEWQEDTQEEDASYRQMLVRKFGEQGAEFIHRLPCVVRVQDDQELEYITMTWHYAGKEYPKHCVGIVIEDSEDRLKIQTGNGKRDYIFIDKKYNTNIVRAPYNGQVQPHPIWGFTAL